jgi:hypothetical protein
MRALHLGSPYSYVMKFMDAWMQTGTLSSGKKVLFVGNERTSSLMVYELSDPAAPIFQSISLSGDTQSPVQDTFTEALIEVRAPSVRFLCTPLVEPRPLLLLS